MGQRIVWATVVGFLSGVFLASVASIGYTIALLAALLGVLAAICILIDRAKRDLLTIVAIVCLALAGGITRMHMSERVGDQALNAALDTTVTITGTVSAEPDQRDTSVRLTIDAETLGTSTPVHARVLVVAPLHTDAPYGERVQVRGELALPEAFDTTLGRSFDYPKYLAKDDILYTLSYAHVSDLNENSGNLVAGLAINLKHLFLHGLARAIPEPEAGLAGGITVGDKRSIGSALSADFQKVSLIHMVVLSGYNITVVVNAVMALLGFAAQSIRFGAAGFVVALFILMAGGAASAVRASLMALIAIYARISHRVFLAGRVLGVVSALMVLWNPWTLVFDPSFQLSALATLGLILFTPFFATHLGRVSERFGMREILASTLATQTMVLPFLLYQSGTLSIFALPANLLALISVPAAMALSVVAACAGIALGPLAPIVGFPAFAILWYEIHVATFFAVLPYSSVGVPAFPAWWLFLAYAALALLYVRYAQNKIVEAV